MEVGEVHISTFRGVSALPLEVARQHSLFFRNGLEVTISYTRSSDELMGGLLDGSFEIVHAAPDNFIACRDRTDAAIVAWIGGSSGPINLVARPEIGAIQELRGARLAVDARGSGWAPILIRLLSGAGLGPDDCELVTTGATPPLTDSLRQAQTL